MDQKTWLADRFESSRPHLRSVAYRIVGSLNDADDAVQETWLRLSRSESDHIENLGGWLTTIVARVCFDNLRSRKSRREEPLDARVSGPLASSERGTDPEQEAQLADSVGLALLVVLEKLTPAERLAFVLHDMFDVPFEEIAPIVGHSPVATRQLASRARRRVQGPAKLPDADLTRQRAVVDAYLAASREGNFDALLAVLDPDVVLRAAGAAEVRGAPVVVKFALAWPERSKFARAVLVNRAVGIVVAPQGRLLVVLDLTIAQGRIVEIDVITQPARLRALDLAVLD